MAKKIPENKFQRIPTLEKEFGITDMIPYAYMYEDSELVVHVMVKAEVKKNFRLLCNVYDEDGDLIYNIESCTYGGSGWVGTHVSKKSYFEWFPFSFRQEPCIDKIQKIRIIPVG